MNLLYHGIDLVQCDRIMKLLRDHGKRFLDRIYTQPEQELFESVNRQMFEWLAGRFAAKEAVMKMLGTGWSGAVRWTDIQTDRGAFGKPEVVLSGGAAERAAEMGITEISISITHAGGLAIASVIGWGQKR